MDKRFYVTLKAARLLKEKGFNEETDCVIDEDSEIFGGNYRMNQDLPEWRWSCPSQAEVIDWLERVHDIHIEFRMQHCKVKGDPMEIKDTDEYAWRWYYAICIGDNVEHPILEEESEGSEYVKLFDLRLEAEDAAIIRALKEIKNKAN